MKKLAAHITLLLFTAMMVLPLSVHGQEEGSPVQTNILFLLDASQSMNDRWDGSPMFDVAKTLIIATVDSLKKKEHFDMALRVYGHGSHYSVGNCKDSKLEVGFGPYSHILIPSRLHEVSPKGITPLAYALEQSANDFPSSRDARNVIIIMTDGKESCKGDPCEVSALLQNKGISLKPFVIGLGYGSEKYTDLDCVGRYFEASTPEEARQSMKEIISKVSQNTTLQVNLLDENGLPTETDLNMSFVAGNILKKNIYHTMNYRGRPDTIEIDPINTYNIKIHSTPPVSLTGQEFEANKHNDIDIPAPQGSLKVSMPFSNALYDRSIQALVSKPNKPFTINVQEINAKDKYLTGYYDLTILTLPPIHLDSVQIRQSHTTEVEIPQPGIISITSKRELVGGIFLYDNYKLSKIADLNDRLLKQTILLQPGKYYLIYRKKFTKRSEETMVKSFTIKSGESQNLNLN